MRCSAAASAAFCAGIAVRQDPKASALGAGELWWMESSGVLPALPQPPAQTLPTDLPDRPWLINSSVVLWWKISLETLGTSHALCASPGLEPLEESQLSTSLWQPLQYWWCNVDIWAEPCPECCSLGFASTHCSQLGSNARFLQGEFKLS